MVVFGVRRRNYYAFTVHLQHSEKDKPFERARAAAVRQSLRLYTVVFS